jgi:CheY-like chemotaxis protein
MSSPNENLEVLIVDDDEMTIFLHEVYVKENKFHSAPKSFYHGKDAADYFNTYFNVAKHYCVLLDINMPVMNAWEFMDEMITKGMSNNISIIILTSSINTADREKAKAYDIVIDYIEKPLSSDYLSKLKSADKMKAFF